MPKRLEVFQPRSFFAGTSAARQPPLGESAMSLRLRMLLVFAITLLAGGAVVYGLTRALLLSSFRDLETDRMRQDVQYALAAFHEFYRDLGATANDYAYWDRMYEFAGNPEAHEIASEFQDPAINGLHVNLIVIVDNDGHALFTKVHDPENLVPTSVLERAVRQLLDRPELSAANIARMPQDGVATLAGHAFLIAVRPIFTSQRTGNSRGLLLCARHFDSDEVAQIGDLTGTSIGWLSVHSDLPSDYREVLAELRRQPGETVVQPLSADSIAGYALVPDLFGDSQFLLRVDTGRPIAARGRLSQRYVFAAFFCSQILSSLVIIFFLQKYVLSRLGHLGRQVESIGERKALSERITVTGNDELSSLALSFNGTLEELEQTHAHFVALTGNIEQIFWIKDAQTHRFKFANPAFEKIIGCPLDILFESPEALWERVIPEDRAALEFVIGLQYKGQPTEMYYRILAKDGGLRWLWERSFPSFDPDGGLRQVIGLTEDITEFKRNEEALLDAQNELEQRVAQRTAELAERGQLVKLLIDSVSVAMYGLDSEGFITFCNRAALKMLGYEREEVLGQHSHTLFHHSHPDGSPYDFRECPIFACFERGADVHIIDEVFWRKDGAPVAVEYDSRQIWRDDRVVGVVVSFVDVTHRKREEIELRLSQKLEAVGRLAAGIAHEINTPVQFVGDNTRFVQASFRDQLRLIHKFNELFDAAVREGFASGLLRQINDIREETDWLYLEKEIPKAIEQSLDGLQRVSTIVRGMKEFSHVDRTSEKAPVDLNRALESTLIVARNELKYVAEVKTDFGKLPPVVCHLGDLNQVFLNLLVNAAHAIGDIVRRHDTKGLITVRTRCGAEWAEISISDTGTGIPQDIRDRVFDPFFTTKGVGKGTGQGLALARAIVVERHGGTLTFDSEVGKGTTFYIRLPLMGAALREEALVS